MNLFVQGVGSKLTGLVTAPSLPLPTTLAGISVNLQEGGVALPGPVPILAVRPILTCVNLPTSGCGLYAAITVQIPFELVPNGGVGPPAAARLTVSENGISGGQLEAFPQPDQIHVVTNCERDALATTACPFAPSKSITHADGSLVTERSPAKPGEQVVMYAFGLGDTLPSVATGQATPSPAPMTLDPFRFQLNFDYRPNAPPSAQLILPPGCSTAAACPELQPVFSGLTPGFAGLYQVNFIVPAPPPGTPACNQSRNHIGSNLTVTLIGLSSFDGGGICVDTTG
jgi:uncharacterized protein (TIGR03437 family)